MKNITIKAVTGIQDAAMAFMCRGQLRHDKRLFSAANQIHKTATAALIRLHGPDAHCNEVDADLWGLVSDLYKDEYGIRPRFHMTYEGAQEWLDRQQEMSDRRQEAIAEAEFWEHVKEAHEQGIEVRQHAYLTNILENGVGESRPTAMELAFKQAGIQ